jgi:phosphoribosylformimino-5-aminoimidazole carboxamide ribonucleotide (ProFAR) isomerase
MYDAFEVLFSFGALMWSAGSTAIRTREWMEVLAKKMGFESMAVGLSLENMTVSARGTGRSPPCALSRHRR